MSYKPVNKSLVSIMDVRCVACFSLDRNLRPMKDTRLINNLCPGLKFSDYSMVCWECEHIIKKIKQFKSRIIKTQSLLKTMWKGVHAGRESLSNLKTTYTSIISIAEVELSDVKPEPISIKLEKNDSELDNIDNESSNDSINNWSNAEDSCKSFTDVKSDNMYQIPMKRPDNSKTSDWLQQEKFNVPKIVGSSTMTLKDLLDQPLQYLAEKQKISKSENEGTSKTENLKESGIGINGEKGNRENSDAWTDNKKCSICLLTFNGQKVFEEHLKRHCNMSSDLFCSVCQQSYPNKVLYDDHYSVNHEKTKRSAVAVPSEEALDPAKRLKKDKCRTSPTDMDLEAQLELLKKPSTSKPGTLISTE